MRELNEQQDRFALAYVANGGNATKAAIEEGYSEHSARKIGSQLLDKPHVAEAILRD
jgi:phage terminase small subunit